MSAAFVKELREKTGAGIVDCMNALKEVGNDFEKAVKWLQEKGAAKAAKKSGAIAAEGVISIVKNDQKVVIFEVNSQTDFVAANDQFRTLVAKIGKTLLINNFTTIEEANTLMTEDNKDVQTLCLEATATIGEKIVLRRASVINLSPSDVVGYYVHVNHRIGAILVSVGGNSEIDRNVAMHIASMNPQYLDEASVPRAQIDAIKAKIKEELASSNKDANIIDKIAQGMLKKKLGEITLVDQEFVMEKMTVGQYLANNGAQAKQMLRFEVGEGIEKQVSNFADEVKAQMK